MAVSTRWNWRTGVCAATLACTACGGGGTLKSDAGEGANGSDSAATGATGSTSGLGEGGARPAAKLGDNVAGKACKVDSDCAGEGATCATMLGGIMGIGALTAEGGYCRGPCDDSSSCGAGGVCAGALGALVMGSCQKACDTDKDCRTSENYLCIDGSIMIPDGGIPMIGDGGPPIVIPSQPKTCAPKPMVVDLDNGVVGKACKKDKDCKGGSCSTSITMGGIAGMGGTAVAYPGGYCSGACAKDEDCGDTGACVGALALGPVNSTGSCLLKCENTKDCGREGYRCRPSTAFGAPGTGAQGANVCQPGEPPTATASFSAIAGSSSPVTGTATFSTISTGVKAVITLTNCPAGDYAFEIHKGAMCDAYGPLWNTERGTIAGATVTCTDNTGTVTIERLDSDAASRWSLDETPDTDIGGHTLLVYAAPIGAAPPLACGAITNVP